MKKNNKIIVCDFHIHTPSSNCYKESVSSNKQYMDILYTAIEKKIDVICITDHNTMHGYFKIKELISNLNKEIDILKKYNATWDDLEQTEKNLDKLNKLQILPGIEITVDPGVHIILILDKNKKKDEVEKFFKELNININDKGDSKKGTNVDVIKLLEKAKEFGCITIAPHIDSDKGIFTSLDKFKDYRAKIIKSKFLDAVTCNNESVKNKIIELTNNDKNYKRDTPLAFICGSDAHDLKNIGTNVTYIESENDIDDIFLKIKTSILHSINSISNVENFELNNKVKQVKKTKRYLCIENFDEDEICSAMCAILNSNFGHILIGLDKSEKLKGIFKNYDDIKNEIINYTKILGIDYDSPLYSIDILEYKESKFIILLSLININSRLYCYKNKAFFVNYKERMIYEPTPYEIETRIKEKIYNEVKKIEKKNALVVESIMKNISMISKSYYHLTINDKIESNGKIILSFVENVYTVQKSNIDLSKYGNGEKNGDYYFSNETKIRLDRTILRYTCPKTSEKIKPDDNSQQCESGEYIVLKKSGASYYINNSSEWYYYSTESDDVIIKINNIETKLLIAWLKSSIFTYIYFKNKNNDNFIMANYTLFLPMFDFRKIEKDKKNEIIKVVNEIIKLENKFLNETQALINTKPADYNEKINEICNNHNNEINNKTKELDVIFFYLLHITPDEKEYISDFIKQNKIFDLYDFQLDNK